MPDIRNGRLGGQREDGGQIPENRKHADEVLGTKLLKGWRAWGAINGNDGDSKGTGRNHLEWKNSSSCL